MILKNHIFATLFASALAIAATGCSDSDDWQPGPETAPDCMGVYFGEISSNMIIGPDDSRLIPVTVGRGLTDKAAVVNINVVSAPEGVGPAPPDCRSTCLFPAHGFRCRTMLFSAPTESIRT